MKQIITVFACLIGLGCFGQTVEEQKLVQTVKEFHQALVTKNTVRINQHSDKALSYGHSNGWVQNKTELIKDLETGLISYSSYQEDSITVSINGNMANVRFKAAIEATMKENTATYNLKVLEVWVQKGKRWVLFARQAVKS